MALKITFKIASVVAAAGFGVAMLAPIAHADAYGAAGCGLGSIVFGNKPGFVQVFAATTNGTFGSQTFGITSGTSNCANTGGGVASVKAFIETNREAVAKDIARGRGETISSLSSLAGCQNSNAVGTTLQREFRSIFPKANMSDGSVGNSVLRTLKSHPELSCRSIS